MARKRKKSLTERIAQVKKAGLGKDPHLVHKHVPIGKLPLPERVNLLLKHMRVWKQDRAKKDSMVFFVMYDIENNKVRTQIAKYLLAQGCERIQKSVYVANLPMADYSRLANDLKEVQEAYENDDSILLLPITNDHLANMRIIGESLDLTLASGQEPGMEWV